MKNTKLGSVQIYYSAYNKAAALEKNKKLYWSLMQLITIMILLLIHGNPTATVFTKLYIYLYEVKRLSNMPKNLLIIHYLCRQYTDTMYKPNATVYVILGEGKLWFQTGADGARLASSGKSI